MDSYFAKFPEFSRVLENTNELEFSRLRSMRGWTRSSAAYRKAFHQFREAMLEETGSEVDKFFLTEYPSFDHYRLGEPRRQFQRLQQSALWARRGGGDSHKAMFTAAYAADFDRNVDRFFKQYGRFDYNPRGEAKAQFEELRKKMDWHFPKEPERWNAGHHKRNTEYASARAKFFTAFIADFKCFFGVGDDVQDWVFLCDVLRVRPAPQTVKECRAVRLLRNSFLIKVLMGSHIYRPSRPTTLTYLTFWITASESSLSSCTRIWRRSKNTPSKSA